MITNLLYNLNQFPMKALYSSVLVFMFSVCFINCSSNEKVEFKNDENNKKVDVYIGNKFFTSYIYPDDMEKQCLYPIVTVSGKTITRGYPLNPRPFERTDHPHHVGLWFNHGAVNGLDFWNNSFAIRPEDKSRYGSIKFKKIVSENSNKGELVTSSDWVDNDNQVLLNEETSFIFSEDGDIRTIERTAKLTAVKDVIFNESKEGMLGLRLDRAFEEPSQRPERFLDANGNVTDVPVLNNEGVNGVYRNAEGIDSAAVWGKRSPWVALRADKDGEVITIVIIDHPDNVNYPAWSHARGYGLFATNNMGGRQFDKNTDEVKLELKSGESTVFKYKVVIGGDLTDAQINDLAKQFK
jgi:hypothetical protein